SLQALSVGRQVRRLFAPQRHDARQILFATGGIVALDHGAQGRLFRRRGSRALRARIDLDEIEDGNADEHQAPEDYQALGITALNTSHLAPPSLIFWQWFAAIYGATLII